MTAQETVMTKISNLPDPLAREVSDFVDFLLMRRDELRWHQWMQFTEGMQLAESDFSDYLPQLQDYEERLARGEIQW